MLNQDSFFFGNSNATLLKPLFQNWKPFLYAKSLNFFMYRTFKENHESKYSILGFNADIIHNIQIAGFKEFCKKVGYNNFIIDEWSENLKLLGAFLLITVTNNKYLT